MESILQDVFVTIIILSLCFVIIHTMQGETRIERWQRDTQRNLNERSKE
jgi:hypothetical protein